MEDQANKAQKMVRDLIEKAAHLNREMSAHIAEAEILQIEALGQWQIAQNMRAVMMTETIKPGALLPHKIALLLLSVLLPCLHCAN